jgi:hypothetical protein
MGLAVTITETRDAKIEARMWLVGATNKVLLILGE